MKKLLLIFLILLITSNAFGATQLKKTIDPDGLHDYTSLEACMNGNEQNLVTADKYFDVEISGTWSSADTTVCTIHNYTTDATRYINIYTVGNARNNGNIYSGYLLKTTTNSSNTILPNISFTTIDGLKFDNNNTFGNNNVMNPTVSNLTIKYCIFTCSSTANSKNIITEGAIGNTYYRNILYNNTIGSGFYLNSGNTSIVYNNTIYNITGATTWGLWSSNTSSVTIKNNLSLGNTVDFLLGSGTTNSNNASSDQTGNVGYRGYTTANEVIDTTPGSLNLLLKTGATSIDSGADLGSPYNVGIAGNTVSGTWDIGADEYVAATTRRIFMVD